MSGNQLIAGYTTGNVDLYDTRESSPVIASFEGTSKIIKAQFLTNRRHELITGASDGSVYIWDVRQKGHVLKLCEPLPENEICSFAIHAQAPLIAYASNTQNVKIMNLNGETLGLIKYHEGFLNRSIGPIFGMEFHPRQLRITINTGISLSMYNSSINAK